MGTKKPLSTIAYDEIILNRGLSKLMEDGIVSFYAYIRHHGEGEGLSEGKEHIHVYVDFYKMVDALELKTQFINEFGNATCLVWRRSNFADWYPYVLHDEDYLQAKGLHREWHYSPEAVVASDPAELDRMICENPMPNCCRLRSAILNGCSEKEMFISGLLTPQNVNGVMALNTILNPKINGDELWLARQKGGKNGSK